MTLGEMVLLLLLEPPEEVLVVKAAKVKI